MILQDVLFCMFHNFTSHRKYVVGDFRKRIKCGLNRVTAIDRNVAMENFLKRFRVGHQAHAVTYEPFQQPLRIRL